MEFLHDLNQACTSTAGTATSLNEQYDVKYNASELAGTVVLTNLREYEDEVQKTYSSARSTNERLRCIADGFQNGILTLRDYMTAAMDETDRAETRILRAMETLIGNLSFTLKIIAQIRTKLNDTTLPVSRYSRENEDIITSRIALYVTHTTVPNDLVYAVRNYAIVVEILICAELLVGYIQRLDTEV